MTDDGLTESEREELERLRKEEKKRRGKTEIYLKVSKKGGVSVYGLNRRYPVTLYKNQWETLLGIADEIKKFIEINDACLARPRFEKKEQEEARSETSDQS